MRFNGGQTIYRAIYWKLMKGRDGDLRSKGLQRN